jgi:hypothetical protein
VSVTAQGLEVLRDASEIVEARAWNPDPIEPEQAVYQHDGERRAANDDPGERDHTVEHRQWRGLLVRSIGCLFKRRLRRLLSASRLVSPPRDADQRDEQKPDDQRGDEDRQHGERRVARLTHRANVMFASC